LFFVCQQRDFAFPVGPCAAGKGIPVCRCKDSKSIHTNGGKKWDSEKKYPSAGASHINADSFSYALVCLSGTLRSKSQNNMHFFDF
jgi:hypothetical protein